MANRKTSWWIGCLVLILALLIAGCASSQTLESTSLITAASDGAASTTSVPSVTTTTEESPPVSDTTTTNAQSDPDVSAPVDTWLEQVRGSEAAFMASDSPWTPWTASFSDEELVAAQSAWCEWAASNAEVDIADSPNWLLDHPVVNEIGVMIAERGTEMTGQQADFTTEILLPTQLRYGLCPSLQPGYSEQELLEAIEVEVIALLSDGVAVMPSSPEDELAQKAFTSVFITCTNIDTSSPGAIAGFILDSVFDADDDITRRLVVASMRSAGSYMCPGRAAQKIEQWATDGYPLG